MRFRSLFAAATTALVIAVGGSSTASADINLPTGNCGFASTNNCLVFDDFNVYSLAVLNYQAGAGPISPGDPYDVSTNGTALQKALVIGTGVSGAGSINTDIITNGGVDNAYSTPNSSGGTTNFQTSASTAGLQGSAITNNSINTWDVNVSDLVNYLDGGKLGFFFNLNQTNTTSYLNNSQDALGWMAVTLTDTKGSNGSVTFWLDGNACDGPLADPTHCDPSQSYKGTTPPLSQADYNQQNILPNDPNHDEWAYIHGQVCMSPAGAIVSFGACAQNDHTNTTVNQNLGASNAAFAMYSELLQQALLSGNYDKMSVDFRMAAVDNGYEQLLIFSALNIPEPITVMMFAAGLLGLAALRRRKLKTA
jgi:hypothetical protein